METLPPRRCISIPPPSGWRASSPPEEERAGQGPNSIECPSPQPSPPRSSRRQPCPGGVYQTQGMELLGHSGGSDGYSAFVGFDKKQRRGVVTLCNQPGWSTLAWAVLQRVPLNQQSTTQFVREIVGIGTGLASDEKTRLLHITQILPTVVLPRIASVKMVSAAWSAGDSAK